MTRIGLVVTGECEANGLAPSLARVFPAAATFHVLVRKNSLTSGDVTLPDSDRTRSRADEFAAELVAATMCSGCDYVIGVDDLELDNAAHPERVVALVRGAVERHVERRYPNALGRRHAVERLQARCSFHLLAPMVESHFFADAATLNVCGIVKGSLFAAGRVDVERFVVEDPDYLSAPYPAAAPREARKRSWARPAGRERHPKAYLKFLCEPHDPLCSERRYREATVGANALRAMDWHQCLAPWSHAALARSLFHDIADMLSISPPPFPGSVHPATSGRPSLLRNL